jgi:hypothetical protein
MNKNLDACGNTFALLRPRTEGPTQDLFRFGVDVWFKQLRGSQEKTLLAINQRVLFDASK